MSSCDRPSSSRSCRDTGGRDALEGGTRHRGVRWANSLPSAPSTTGTPAIFSIPAEMLRRSPWGSCGAGALRRSTRKAALIAAITAKGHQPGAEAIARGDFWVHATHNWNTVCCGALVLGALSLRHGAKVEVPDQHPVFAPALAGLRKGLSAFGDDGGYAEGVAYWTLAMRAALLAESALLAAGVSQRCRSILRPAGGFRATWWRPSGRPFDFGDTPPDWERPDCLGLLASLAADPEAARWHREAPGTRTGLDLPVARTAGADPVQLRGCLADLVHRLV